MNYEKLKGATSCILLEMPEGIHVEIVKRTNLFGFNSTLTVKTETNTIKNPDKKEYYPFNMIPHLINKVNFPENLILKGFITGNFKGRPVTGKTYNKAALKGFCNGEQYKEIDEFYGKKIDFKYFNTKNAYRLFSYQASTSYLPKLKPVATSLHYTVGKLADAGMKFIYNCPFLDTCKDFTEKGLNKKLEKIFNSKSLISKNALFPRGVIVIINKGYEQVVEFVDHPYYKELVDERKETERSRKGYLRVVV